MQISLDTVYYLAAMLERPAEAKTAYARAVGRIPLSSLRPEERNWRQIARLAVRMHDPALARQAADGFEHDQAAGAPDVEGGRAFFAAHVAMTEQRWDAALDALRTADQKYAIFDKYAFVLFAQAHDLAGHADSAIYYFEKFATFKDPNMSEDAQFLPGTYKRLGELYEAKGNTAKAVENYEKFVELWKNAEPEMQPQLQAMREKIAKLAPVERVKKGSM
jgi:tetratricopeptide (TPR) repeat protein